nr:helix-turn-helix domain-containing protein [Micromonospora sp. DSM 115978]
MARSERPLDPAAGPVQAFAAELRRLREAAGRPTYAAMARRAHRSPSSLSEAAGGKRLPTLDTTLAYVRALGGDEAAWTARWREAHHRLLPTGEDTGDDPGAGSALPNDNQPTESAQFTPSDHVVSGGPIKSPRAGDLAILHSVRRRLSTRVLWVVLAICLTAFTLSALPHGEPGSGTGSASNPPAGPPLDGLTPAASGPPATPVLTGDWDGVDPKEAGCADDPWLDSLDTSAVLVDDQVVGVVELRYSPSCGTGWPRFLPAAPGQADLPPDTRVHVGMVDGVDPRRWTDFAMDYAGLSVYGDMLINVTSCVAATAYFSGLGWRSAVARTGCYRGTTRVPVAAGSGTPPAAPTR